MSEVGGTEMVKMFSVFAVGVVTGMVLDVVILFAAIFTAVAFEGKRDEEAARKMKGRN